jgi:death-on-curing protein
VNPPIFLTIEEVEHLHEHEVERRGGSNGLRDLGMLESAMAMPQAGFGDEYLHEDIFEMAAAYLFHIVMNHPFIDGNKRAGFVAAVVFLDINGLELVISEDDAYDLVIGVCEGTVTKKALAAAFRENSAPFAE